MKDFSSKMAGKTYRRTLLKAIGASGLAVGAFSGQVGASHHCDLVVGGSGGYSSIQAAIDDAADGETVCVTPGTYQEEVTVYKAVTVEGTTEPTGGNPAMVDGSIDVSAEDATVSRLKVTRSETVTPGGLDPAGILVTASGVTIEKNLVTDITANAGITDGSVTLNGIQIWDDGPATVDDVNVRKNVVTNLMNESVDENGNTITSPEWPHYGGVAGIKVQGVLDGTSVEGNTVRNLHSSGWAWGIVTTHTGNAPGVSPKNTTVTWNTVTEVNDGSEYDVFTNLEAAPYPGATFGIDGNSNADEATVKFNNFLGSPVGAQNKDEDNTLVAECNYWGHARGPATELSENSMATTIVGPGATEYTPWSVRKIGRGKHPQKSCVGGKNENKGKGKGT